VSVRLDPAVREVLEAEARARRIGLSTYLRELAADAARAARRRRIRDESRAVAEHLARDPEAGALYEDWGKAGGEVG
jgi:hypothetical protein